MLEMRWRASRPPMLWAMMLTGVRVSSSPRAPPSAPDEPREAGNGEEDAAEEEQEEEEEDKAEEISTASLAARSSMELEGGTVAATTRGQPCAVRACRMPCQYCSGGRRAEMESSEKPSRPWARTMGCRGVAGQSERGRQ